MATKKPKPTPSPQASGQDASVDTQVQDALNKARTGGPALITTTGTGTSYGITPKETAYSELDQQMIALFGRKATVAEKSAYYKALNVAEKHYATVSQNKQITKDIRKNPTQQITSGSDSTTNYLFSKPNFLLDFTTNLASNYIKAGKPLGGQAADNYNTLKTYAAAMGVSDDDKTLLRNTIQSVKGTKDVNVLKSDIRKRSISLYAGLADSLERDPSLTVKEAANDYINIMSNMLDINANSISLLDPTLSKAINATTKEGKPYRMNLNEFMSTLRNDSRFQYSTTAHQEASDLASSFAQAFGFGG